MTRETRLTSIERSRVVVALQPWVDKSDLLTSVRDNGREVTSLEEVLLLEVQSDHLVDPRVDVWERNEERGSASTSPS